MSYEVQKQKTERVFLLSPLGTQTRDRTGMEVNPLVFETSASTDSAIWAFRLNAVQRYGFFSTVQENKIKKKRFL